MTMLTEAEMVELYRILKYDPATGLFTWRYRSDKSEQYNNRWAERPALNCKDHSGYVKGQLLGKTKYAHTVAWAYMFGEWRSDLFHANRDKADNKLTNLRARGLPNGPENRKELLARYWRLTDPELP